MTFAEQICHCRGSRLMIGGHRGYASDAVRENTIPCFEQAQAMGVDYIEIDVQLTKDGQAVVFHDMELSDRTPLSGRIHHYTVAELKQAFELDTLSEALAWCKSHGMKVLLEVKSKELEDHADMPVLAERIVEAIHEHDFGEQIVVFGINHWILKRVHELDSTVPLALIVPHVPADPAALMRDMDAMIYLCYIDNLSRELVAQLHDAGFIVDGSVINTPERLRLALDIGCDMIESDHPDRIIAAYHALPEGSAHA